MKPEGGCKEPAVWVALRGVPFLVCIYAVTSENRRCLLFPAEDTKTLASKRSRDTRERSEKSF